MKLDLSAVLYQHFHWRKSHNTMLHTNTTIFHLRKGRSCINLYITSHVYNEYLCVACTEKSTCHNTIHLRRQVVTGREQGGRIPSSGVRHEEHIGMAKAKVLTKSHQPFFSPHSSHNKPLQPLLQLLHLPHYPCTPMLLPHIAKPEHLPLPIRLMLPRKRHAQLRLPAQREPPAAVS